MSLWPRPVSSSSPFPPSLHAPFLEKERLIAHLFRALPSGVWKPQGQPNTGKFLMVVLKMNDKGTYKSLANQVLSSSFNKQKEDLIKLLS